MADAPEVTHNTAADRFEVNLDGDTAFADYRVEAGDITLPHTVVPPAFEGRGVGSALAKAALGYARDHALKVIPICPFIAAYLQKHPAEWRDIVHDTYRAKLGLG